MQGARTPHICVKRAIARAPRRAARRRRDSPSHTSVHRSSECAGGDRCRCQLRCACGSSSDSVSCMLGAQRVPTDRFKRGVPAHGELTRIRPANLLSAPRCVASLQTCRDRENLQSKNRRLYCGECAGSKPYEDAAWVKDGSRLERGLIPNLLYGFG